MNCRGKLLVAVMIVSLVGCKNRTHPVVEYPLNSGTDVQQGIILSGRNAQQEITLSGRNAAPSYVAEMYVQKSLREAAIDINRNTEAILGSATIDIDVGAAPDDGTGDPLWKALEKVSRNLQLIKARQR